MANTPSIRQKKLERVVFEPQAALGTAETFDTASLAIPVTNFSMTPSRGDKIISRATTGDGYAGAVVGAPGGFGWSLSFDCEMHDVGNSTQYPYWAQLLLGCGHEAKYDGDGGTVTFTPSTQEMTGWSNPTNADHAPIALSFGNLMERNAGAKDSAQYCFDSTGVATFNIETGGILTTNFAFVGRVVDNKLVATGITDVMKSGSFSQVEGSPFVVKGIEITLKDNDDGGEIVIDAIPSITISSNAATPDVPNPSDSQAMGLSPVFWDDAPTVSFSFAEGDDNEEYILQKWLAGTTFSLEIVVSGGAISGGGNRQLKWTIPFLQSTDIATGESNGYATYELQGIAARQKLGDNTPPYSIEWTF